MVLSVATIRKSFFFFASLAVNNLEILFKKKRIQEYLIWSFIYFYRLSTLFWSQWLRTRGMPIDEFSWQEMVVGNGSSFHKKGPWFISLKEKSRLKRKKNHWSVFHCRLDQRKIWIYEIDSPCRSSFFKEKWNQTLTISFCSATIGLAF